jgi:glutamate 5-kinase
VDEQAVRKKLMDGVGRIVVKIGSNLLVSLGIGLNIPRINNLVEQLSVLHQRDLQIVLVSSGAIAAGMERLHVTKRPKSIAELQAAAAVGQSTLMHIYEQAFAPWNIGVGQVLLTHADLRNRKRYLNARSTLLTLLNLGVIPIVNENDSVTVDEIKVGDNDTLAALVTSLVDADLLIILTDIDGLYDGDPEDGANVISLVTTVTRDIEDKARGSRSEVGIGGMLTKVRAAKLAGRCCVPTVVASGTDSGALARILSGDVAGTLFLPREQILRGRKRWIGLTLRPKGFLQVDGGAYVAVVENGKSLLPSGINEVHGAFGRGDAVSCIDLKGHVFARGLVNYDSNELIRIMGHRSSEIEKLLGYKYTDEVIHRDNLVVL